MVLRKSPVDRGWEMCCTNSVHFMQMLWMGPLSGAPGSGRCAPSAGVPAVREGPVGEHSAVLRHFCHPPLLASWLPWLLLARPVFIVSAADLALQIL